jgi:hypothetical protein
MARVSASLATFTVPDAAEGSGIPFRALSIAEVVAMSDPQSRVQARRAAAAAVLDAYREGRPVEELRTQLPQELEATGQRLAAEFVRSFFAPHAPDHEPSSPAQS